MSVTYEAVLDMSDDGFGFLTELLDAERVRRGTRSNTRVLDTRAPAVLVLRWFLDDIRMAGLARDNTISISTAYAYRDEAIAALAARRPSLHGALLAAKVAGHSHVITDGTLIHTDRISTPGPTTGVDLWWSGKHKHHGGNIQVVSAPDGWPLWTSEVRPGREHDTTTTAARTDPHLLAALTAWVADGRPGLADLGYQGEPEVAAHGHAAEVVGSSHLPGAFRAGERLASRTTSPLFRRHLVLQTRRINPTSAVHPGLCRNFQVRRRVSTRVNRPAIQSSRLSVPAGQPAVSHGHRLIILRPHNRA